MSRKTNLNKSRARDNKRQVATYGTQTPLSSAAVERGSTRWLAGSNVQIDGILAVAGTFNVSGVSTFSGALTIAGPTGITGSLTIQGVTDITGQLNVTGPTSLDGITTIGGDTTVTGLLNVQGDTTIAGLLAIEGDSTISGKLDVTGPMATKGTLSVEGVTTLKNDLNITSGGTITAGNLMIEPANGGQINFLGGSLSSSATFGMLMNHSTNMDFTAPTINLNAQLVKTPTKILVGTSTEIQQDRLRIGSLPDTSIATANVHVDSSGIFYRVVT